MSLEDTGQFRDTFWAEVRRIDGARAQQEVALTTLKGDVTRFEALVRTGSSMTIGETIVEINGRLKIIEGGESERRDFSKWMKRVLPFSVLALLFSLLGATVAMWKALKGG